MAKNTADNFSLITLEEILKLTATDLLSEEKFLAISDSILQDPLYAFAFGDNRKLSQYLESMLPALKSSGNLTAGCRMLINYLKYLRLPTLLDEDIKEIFKTSILDAILSGVDILERLEMYFGIKLYDAVEQKRQLAVLAQAMRKNSEYVGRDKIVINNEDLPQTVGNWLRDYDVFSSSKPDREAIDRISYFNSAPNLRKINAGEKEVVLKLTEIYDRLRSGSLAPSALEPASPVGKIPGLPSFAKAAEGESSPVKVYAPTIAAPKAPKKEYTREEIMKKYQGDAAENNKVLSHADRLAGLTGGDFLKITDELYSIINEIQPDKTELLGALYLLAKQEKLDDLLKEDRRFYKLLEDEFNRTGQRQLLNDFQVYPMAPQFIGHFLSLVLEKKLKLSENEAARWGLYLGNILKQAGNDKYTQIAYFDMQSGEFRWKK